MKQMVIKNNYIDERIREIKVNASLSKARDNGMKIAKDALDESNNFIANSNIWFKRWLF